MGCIFLNTKLLYGLVGLYVGIYDVCIYFFSGYYVNRDNQKKITYQLNRTISFVLSYIHTYTHIYIYTLYTLYIYIYKYKYINIYIYIYVCVCVMKKTYEHSPLYVSVNKKLLLLSTIKVTTFTVKKFRRCTSTK